jgi:hypothetical protein
MSSNRDCTKYYPPTCDRIALHRSIGRSRRRDDGVVGEGWYVDKNLGSVLAIDTDCALK